MMSLGASIFFFLPRIAFTPIIEAKHVVCSWKVGISTPDKYGFEKASHSCLPSSAIRRSLTPPPSPNVFWRQFCTAPALITEVQDNTTGLYKTTATFSCSGPFQNNVVIPAT